MPKKPVSHFPLFDAMRRTILRWILTLEYLIFTKTLHISGVCVFPACQMKKWGLRKMNTSCREKTQGPCAFLFVSNLSKENTDVYSVIFFFFTDFIERCFLKPDSIKEETEWELWSCQTGLPHISPKLIWQKTQTSGLDSNRCSQLWLLTKPMMWIHL